MANKSYLLGKVQKDVGGYKIRQMGTSKTFKGTGGSERTLFQHNGKFGVYAGRKKLVKSGFKTVLSATDYIESNLVK